MDIWSYIALGVFNKVCLCSCEKAKKIAARIKISSCSQTTHHFLLGNFNIQNTRAIFVGLDDVEAVTIISIIVIGFIIIFISSVILENLKTNT
jgi:hypothetical protein